MSDENIEARLARWRLAKPPSELMRRLHAYAPAPRINPQPKRRPGEWFAGLTWRPWPLAYAGLLVVWMLIFALRLTTPPEPKPAASAITASTDPASPNAPVFVGTLAAERTFLLGRNDLDQP